MPSLLETRRAETESNIESLSISFASVEPAEMVIVENHPISQQIAELDSGLLILREKLVAQTAQQQELAQARDLAWQTYQALAKKEQEVAVAAGSTGTEVRLASNSAVPDGPVGISNLMTTLLAAIAGGMLALSTLIVVFWWRESDVIKEEQGDRATE